MPRQSLAAVSVIAVIVLSTFTARLNRSVSASPKELNVISRTKGNEVLTAEVFDNQLTIKLKNNHKDTITAFAIRFRDTTIKEDFAYSDVHFGIEPGDTFQTSYPLSPSPTGELPTVYLLTVVLKDDTNDGDSKIAQEIEDVRLADKIQLLRTLRILEREGLSGKELKIIKSDIVAALNAGELETRITLKELKPGSGADSKLSDALKSGLHWGRETILRRFEELEQVPTDYRELAFTRLKERAHKLFAKL